MAPRRRCPTCGSRQWHKEPSSGLIACSEGHLLQNYRNEATDAEDLGHHALRKRTLKSGRKKKEGGSKANEKRSLVDHALWDAVYHGARGRYHYFECLQLLLRKQVATLIPLWGLPAEFEIICRDVWALHLDLLPNPPPAEPYRYAQEVRDAEVQGDKDVDEGNEKRKEKESEDDDSSSEEDSDDDSQEEVKGPRAEDDSELAALLRVNSDVDESSTEEEEEEDKDKSSTRKGKDKGKKSNKGIGRMRGRHVYESPASTIAVLVVACWTLRVPALCRDFTRLIESYELPYLDPVVRHLLPTSMTSHLTKHNIQALSPYHAPSAQALHALASRLSKLMNSTYGIFTPEANAAPILWRVVSQGLGGTPMLYKMTKRLAQILSLPLTLHYTLAAVAGKFGEHDAERHVHDNVAPEVALMATGIVVLKMVYGLDGRPRVPGDAADMARGLPRLDVYLAGLRRLEEEEKARSCGGMFDARADVCMGDLSEEMMDEYLGFSSRVLIGEGSGDAVLERYFPIARGDVHRGGEIESKSWRPLEATVEDGSGLRPGEGYRMYRARDVEGTMASEYGAVVRRGAQWAGVSVSDLGGVVEAYERRATRWWDRERRQ
ncbi:hypothetical protein DXG03_000335 [Asterophora parasitica]|uniref:RRN7-type domain-containing protein n=1 Tax=Asterophora parasitica TaxID=117018 RepID=A0A9P7KEC2_9AGAR|nr:hypothetical protein DXG03_000335 [Asterophora parasitica]